MTEKYPPTISFLALEIKVKGNISKQLHLSQEDREAVITEVLVAAKRLPGKGHLYENDAARVATFLGLRREARKLAEAAYTDCLLYEGSNAREEAKCIADEHKLPIPSIIKLNIIYLFNVIKGRISNNPN